MNAIFGLAILLAIGYILVTTLSRVLPHDDTDAPGKRSGLQVYTDHKTGCQYLTSGVGGLMGHLTPRLGKDGTPMCEVKP